MGTITKRTNPSGEIKYRAQIRIKRSGMPDYSESKTFSKKTLASEWIKRRELEIEANPDIILQNDTTNITLADALIKYLNEVESFGRSKRMGLRYLTGWPIGKKDITQLTRKDFSDHTLLRKNGFPEIGEEPISASTALQDLQYFKSVLDHAYYVWGMKVNIYELECATKGLRQARIVTSSIKRNRLPTNEELQLLTNYFYKKWQKKSNTMPLHLIMWLAIYTCRRQDELTRLYLNNYDTMHQEWLVRNLKNPNGSMGNDKKFIVTDFAQQVIQELMDKTVKQRMMKSGTDENLLIPLMAKSFATRFHEGVKMCGIDDLRFHDLRHEGATRLAEDGLTIPQMQQITLHDSWGSLERYVNLKTRPNRLEFDVAMKIAKNSI